MEVGGGGIGPMSLLEVDLEEVWNVKLDKLVEAKRASKCTLARRVILVCVLVFTVGGHGHVSVVGTKNTHRT